MKVPKIVICASVLAVAFCKPTFEERKERLAKTLEGSEDYSGKISRAKYDPKWFTALSKIARVRTADGRSWEPYEEAQTSSKKFHCRPIEDIYVPKVAWKLPAYACKMGNRKFILTSERFLQDRRAHVDVSVDDGTFLRLNSGPRNNLSPEVIPAKLVLNTDKNNYKIKTED